METRIRQPRAPQLMLKTHPGQDLGPISRVKTAIRIFFSEQSGVADWRNFARFSDCMLFISQDLSFDDSS